MPSLRDKILSNIHKQKLAPRPRWQYAMAHFILWSVCLLTLLSGSVAFSLMLMEFNMPERVFVRWMDMQENAGFLLALPYLWFLGVLLALFFGYFLFSRTGRGYRFHALFVVSSLFGGSLILGWILFSTHAVQWGEERILRLEPHYRDFRGGMRKMMPRPEDGILPLRVLKIDDENFMGIAPDGQIWTVYFVCKDRNCFEQREKIILGKPIMFGGVLSGNRLFTADRLLFGVKMLPYFRLNVTSEKRENNAIEKKRK